MQIKGEQGRKGKNVSARQEMLHQTLEGFLHEEIESKCVCKRFITQLNWLNTYAIQ